MIIAEIGCNHKGDMKIAKQMIDIGAHYCGVDIVKFQKRNNRELLGDGYDDPHPCPENSYGDSYGLHRDYLEFDITKHKQLKRWCEDVGVIYSCSVWDMTSAKQIASLDPVMIKIPSAKNNHVEMLEWLNINYRGQVHISTGMTTQEELDIAVSTFGSRLEDIVLYACTSGYPVPFEDICLLEIQRLITDYPVKVGFSGHHLGIAVDMAAWALGAEYIERHYTLDRTWKGTDHAASLEPDGLRKLVRDIRAVDAALTYRPQEILDIEAVQRDKLKGATA